MNRLFPQGRDFPGVALLLLLTLIYVPSMGAANHYCFDGMESPVSIHFDNLNGHDTHEDESGHVDVEKQLLDDNLVGKLSDFVSLPASGVTLKQANYESVSLLPVTDFIPAYANTWQLSPPLRAPPRLS